MNDNFNKDREEFLSRFRYPFEETKFFYPIRDVREFFSVEQENPLVLFAKNLLNAGGEFYFADSYEELVVAVNLLLKHLNVNKIYCLNDELLSMLRLQDVELLDEKDDLSSNEVTISECECLCARTGTVVMSSFLSTGRRAIFSNDVLLVVASTSQVVYDIADAFDFLQTKYRKNMPSLITFITGPSRTADIEKELILGAHGSKRLIVFLYDSK